MDGAPQAWLDSDVSLTLVLEDDALDPETVKIANGPDGPTDRLSNPQTYLLNWWRVVRNVTWNR